VSAYFTKGFSVVNIILNEILRGNKLIEYSVFLILGKIAKKTVWRSAFC